MNPYDEQYFAKRAMGASDDFDWADSYIDDDAYDDDDSALSFDDDITEEFDDEPFGEDPYFEEE
jgi:hypothetical protein